MRFEKAILIVLIIMSITACSTFMPQPETVEQRMCKTMLDREVVIYNTEQYDITIVGFKDNIEIIYDALDPLTLEQAGQKHDYRYVINGSYFENSREHAGWLSVFGTQHAPLKEDKQLSHMVVLNKDLGYIDFPGLDLWESSMTSSANIEFQSGPLVIHNNIVDTLSIKASINGQGSHLRTFLAYTDEDDMKYFIISRQAGQLVYMAEHLLSLPLFENKTLSVMNLDGGSSTALYSRDYLMLNFNVKRPLPILLGIK